MLTKFCFTEFPQYLFWHIVDFLLFDKVWIVFCFAEFAMSSDWHSEDLFERVWFIFCVDCSRVFFIVLNIFCLEEFGFSFGWKCADYIVFGRNYFIFCWTECELWIVRPVLFVLLIVWCPDVCCVSNMMSRCVKSHEKKTTLVCIWQ